MGKLRAIRYEEWLNELHRISHEHQANGFSRRDIEAVLDMAEQSAGERLRKWHRLGLIEFAGYRTEYMIDGRPFKLPVYRLTAKPAKKR